MNTLAACKSLRWLAIIGLAALISACSSSREPNADVLNKSAENKSKPSTGYTPGNKASRDPKLPAPSKDGGFYMDDGPPENIPPGLENTPDAQPKEEPLNKFANKPYNVLGDTWVPDTSNKPYAAEGTASWYGKKFHGKKTSSGDLYDVFGMSAAHRTLPIPSYARITNTSNGKSVIVRINDRGPFHSERLIDLSYAAAFKLGYASKGSTKVRVERVFPTGSSPSATQLAKQDDNGNLPGSNTVPAANNTTEKLFYVQLGSFSQKANAEAYLNRLSNSINLPGKQLQVVQHKNLHKVVLGQFSSEQEARSNAATLKSQSGMNAIALTLQ